MTPARLWPWALIVFALATGPSPARPAMLRGRVVTIENHPATETPLAIAGQAALVNIRRPSGEFELTLSGHPSAVQVAVLEGPLKVLYPLDGWIPVPRDESQYVTVVVGKPETNFIADKLAERILKLESILKSNGVSFNASVDSLGSDLRRVLSQLDLTDSDLRLEIADKRGRAAVTPEILRLLADYVLKVKDLRDAFRRFPELAVSDGRAMAALKASMAGYNAAFTALNDNRQAFDSQLASYWGTDRGAVVRKSLADVYFEAIENVHKSIILPLNPDLITLQLASGPRPPRRDKLADAVHRLNQAADQLATRIDAIEAREADLQGLLKEE
jgi:hypothetical protein